MKGFEDRIDLALLDTDAGVDDLEFDAAFVVRRLNFYLDRSLGGELDGVVENILKDALDLGAITNNRQLLIAAMYVHLQTLLTDRLFMAFESLADDVARIESLQGRVRVTGVERSHPQHVVDQLEQLFRIA